MGIILLGAALVSFIVATIPVPTRINCVALGLVFLTLDLLLPGIPLH